MLDNNQEYIICAAIHWDDKQVYAHQASNIQSGLCIAGWRHGNIIIICSKIFGNVAERIKADIQETQGFLTSHNRFLNRAEAAKFILEIGQKDKLIYFGGLELDSSDLY